MTKDDLEKLTDEELEKESCKRHLSMQNNSLIISYVLNTYCIGEKEIKELINYLQEFLATNNKLQNYIYIEHEYDDVNLQYHKKYLNFTPQQRIEIIDMILAYDKMIIEEKKLAKIKKEKQERSQYERLKKKFEGKV